MRSEPDEGAAINFDAETWPLGYADNAPIVLDRIRQHGLPDGMLGAVELEHWLDRRKGGRSVGRQDGKRWDHAGTQWMHAWDEDRAKQHSRYRAALAVPWLPPSMG